MTAVRRFWLWVVGRNCKQCRHCRRGRYYNLPECTEGGGCKSVPPQAARDCPHFETASQ